MKIFANELSLHRQFRDIRSFARAMDEIMAMRSVARRRGLDTHCHRRFLEIEPVQGMVMQQAVQQLPRSRVRAVLGWLTTDTTTISSQPMECNRICPLCLPARVYFMGIFEV